MDLRDPSIRLSPQISGRIERLAASGNVALQRYLFERAWAEAFRAGRHDVCRWLAARAGKPRVRGFMRWQHTAPSNPEDASETFLADDPYGFTYYAFVGPNGRRSTMRSGETPKTLQQAWCAFCDHHLRLLGLDTQTMTLGPPPVSGKSGGGFPLTAGFP
jgi:hypothetical protein